MQYLERYQLASNDAWLDRVLGCLLGVLWVMHSATQLSSTRWQRFASASASKD